MQSSLMLGGGFEPALLFLTDAGGLSRRQYSKGIDSMATKDREPVLFIRSEVLSIQAARPGSRRPDPDPREETQ
jgi:hypothetical protein